MKKSSIAQIILMSVVATSMIACSSDKKRSPRVAPVVEDTPVDSPSVEEQKLSRDEIVDKISAIDSTLKANEIPRGMVHADFDSAYKNWSEAREQQIRVESSSVTGPIEKHQAEQKLRESAEKFKKVFDEKRDFNKERDSLIAERADFSKQVEIMDLERAISTGEAALSGQNEMAIRAVQEKDIAEKKALLEKLQEKE